MTTRLLITGATGLVGTAMCDLAVRRGLAVKGVLRIRWEVFFCMESCVVGEIINATY
jgi:GDP-D-mannose dehydratase